MNLEEELRYDNFKSRIVRNLLLRLKTEKEVRDKYSRYDDSDLYLERAIEEIKEYGYIDDEKYARLYIQDAIILEKRNSIFELKQKLIQKGVSSNYIYNAISENEEELNELEQKVIKKILYNKRKKEEDKVISYLYRKGFNTRNIQNAVADYKYERDNVSNGRKKY